MKDNQSPMTYLKNFQSNRFRKKDKKDVSWHYPKLDKNMGSGEKFGFLRSDTDSIPLKYNFNSKENPQYRKNKISDFFEKNVKISIHKFPDLVSKV